MDSGSKKFRQTDNIQLTDTITCTASCKQFICAATLDDTICIWKNNLGAQFNKTPLTNLTGVATGIIDLKFSPSSTHLAITSMDSFIRIWQLQSNEIKTIQCSPMSAWKMQYAGQNLAVGGDLGKVSFYDLTSKQITKKLDLGQVFLSSIAKSNSGLLAAGNSFGDVYITNLQKKNMTMNLKPHYRSVKGLNFTEDSTKLLTGSEDSTIKVIDISSEKIVTSLQGHKQTVSCIKTDLNDSKIAYSCSFDKSVKSWDIRMKSCIDTFQTGSPLWSLQTLGKNIIAGGENGVLSFFSLE